MKRSALALVAALPLLLLFAHTSHAQGSLDPDCYYPTFGDGIDTVTQLGGNISSFGGDWYDIGPNPLTGEQRIICAITEGGRLEMAALSSGKLLDLHRLDVRARWDINFPYQQTYFGHFHSPSVLDALCVESHSARIYWADEEGNFDSSRYSFLRSTVNGDMGTTADGNGFDFAIFGISSAPYIGKLVSDSLDDILLFGRTDWQQPYSKLRDSSRSLIELFVGDKLYQSSTTGGIIVNDSTQDLGPYFYNDGAEEGLEQSRSVFEAGDFSNSGRTSLIAQDHYSNLFYYRNTGPFSMRTLAQSLLYDTLMAYRDNPSMSGFAEHHSSRVLPKPDWDHSSDLIIRGSGVVGDHQDAFEFFRGGPDFGSKRLLIDSSFFTLYSPYHLGGFGSYTPFWGMGFCGDLTGSGQPVVRLASSNSTTHEGYEFYYVLGKALDNKADIFVHLSGVGSGTDVIPADADGDRYGDVYYRISVSTADSTVMRRNGFAMLHGSPKIPVRLNPTYAVPRDFHPDEQLHAYPNPAGLGTNVTFLSNGERATVEFVDLLGRVVMSAIVDTDPARTTMYLPLEDIAEGSYQLLVKTTQASMATSVIVKR